MTVSASRVLTQWTSDTLVLLYMFRGSFNTPCLLHELFIIGGNSIIVRSGINSRSSFVISNTNYYVSIFF